MLSDFAFQGGDRAESTNSLEGIDLADLDSRGPGFEANVLAASRVLICVAGAALLQVPEVRKACLGVAMDTRVRQELLDSVARIGSALEASWREHGTEVVPALLARLRAVQL